MKKHHVDVLIAESDVHSRIAELGAEITKHYQEKQVNNLVVIGLLRAHLCLWLILYATFIYL